MSPKIPQPEGASPERLLALVEAYGADPRRWPAAERAAGEAALKGADPDLRRALDEAARLDRMLDASPALRVDAALAGRVAQAMQGEAARGLRKRLRLWWAGAALAGLGLSGAAAGAMAMSVLAPQARPTVQNLDLYDGVTAFGPAQDFGGE